MENNSFRIYQEEIEAKTLSPHACLSANSRGRQYPMEPCPVRTEFIRDRDRIVHCKSFRRLKHKTQVFLSPVGDHYRTRLTHTLEVSQIARTIARALMLNEDLTEAISLGHDLGHTPFGHAGESVLNELVPGGFEHNEQSLRVVEKLENGKGLNLTWEVRDGIVNHKKNGNPATLEGAVVSLSDRIAYINHDIDDAARAGVLDPNSIPESCKRVLGNSHGERINSMIMDILLVSFDKPYVRMSESVRDQFEYLREFLFEKVYYNQEAKKAEKKAMRVVEQLYAYYLHHIELLPDEFKQYLEEDGPERVAADYIACMTDRYAITDYERLFVPQGWI